MGSGRQAGRGGRLSQQMGTVMCGVKPAGIAVGGCRENLESPLGVGDVGWLEEGSWQSWQSWQNVQRKERWRCVTKAKEGPGLRSRLQGRSRQAEERKEWPKEGKSRAAAAAPALRS